MTTQIKSYSIVEKAKSLFGDWLKHRREMRELREINSGDFARIAQELCFSPHRSRYARPSGTTRLRRIAEAFEIPRHRCCGPVAHAIAVATRHGTRLCLMSTKGQVRP
jgi:hypothetical protein